MKYKTKDENGWINDYDGKVYIDGKHIPAYRCWKSIETRCCSDDYHKRQPTYIGCDAVDDWKSFSKFKEWYDQHGDVEGLQLDKDLASPGNKVYGPEMCIFVPSQINTLFTDSRATRGEYPQGVYFHKLAGKFNAQIKIHGKRKHIGYFKTVDGAEIAYLKAKIAYVKQSMDELSTTPYALDDPIRFKKLKYGVKWRIYDIKKRLAVLEGKSFNEAIKENTQRNGTQLELFAKTA